MKTKPKDFYCVECAREYYGDDVKCRGCGEKNTIIPIPKELYRCYLNGSLYGVGDLAYMQELFKDYVVDCKMYGKKECDFKVVRGIA